MRCALAALVCCCLMASPLRLARAAPPTPAELATPPAAPPADVDAIDDAYDAGFWHGTGPALLSFGLLTAIPGLTGLVTGIVQQESAVAGPVAAILTLAGLQIGIGAWFVLDRPTDGPAAARQAGVTAGQGMAMASYGALFTATAISIFASGDGTDYGGEFLTLPVGLLMLGFGTAGYVEGKSAHRGLVDEMRPQPVSGLRHVRPDDAPRAAVLPVFGVGW